MPSFRVTWEIDVDADSHEEAARLAWHYMRKEASTANCFDVFKEGDTEGTRIDLQEIDEQVQEMRKLEGKR